MEKVFISVFMISYNHKQYIGKAIESILAQNCTYRIEIIISDDCSKDNTQAIIREFAALHPCIHPLYNNVNIGMQKNTVQCLNECKGKYIAFLEGDDYWLDPYKLQKQADFMEEHPDFTICFSDVGIEDELNFKQLFFPKLNKDVFTIEDFILSDMNIIPTPSLFIRNSLPVPMPDFFDKAAACDMTIQLLLADKGKAKFINEKLAVYRNHAGGVTKSPEQMQKGEQALKNTYHDINKYLKYKYDKIFNMRFLAMAKSSLIYGAKDKKGLKKIKHYLKSFPEYIKYSEKINLKEIFYYHLILFFPFILKRSKK